MAKITSILALLLSAVAAAPQAAQSSAAATTTGLSSPSSTGESSLTSEERDELFSLHEELINIPSTSGNENDCADWLAEYLEELGYGVEKIPVANKTNYNVLAKPSGLDGLPEVLITSHIDTVPPFYGFEKMEVNGTTYHFGRGSVDAKAAIAAMVTSTHKFLESRDDNPSLGMLFVVDEETGGAGMKAFAEYSKNTTFRAGIFGEPTEGKLATAHKGTLSMTLNVTGRASHSAYPHLGIPAIHYLAEAIVALNSLEPALPRSELLGASTLNAGVIRGGVAANVVSEAANSSFSIRVARSEDDAVQNLKDAITGMLTPIKERMEEAEGKFDIIFAEGASPAQILDTDVEGLESAPVFYGTDIPRLPQVEKRYLYGTGTIEVAHTDEEMLSQDELVEAAEAYGKILRAVFAEKD